MKKASPITLEKYLEETAPEAFAKLRRAWAACRFPGDAGENSPEFKRLREAHLQCRQVLLEDHEEEKFEVWGRHRDNPMSRFAVLDEDRQREVLEQWNYSPDRRPPGVVYLPDCGDVPVRVFLLDGQRVGVDETNYEEMLKHSTDEMVVIHAVEKLIAEGDQGGPGFPRRVHERMGAPPKPKLDTVRKYVWRLFPELKKGSAKN